ncbi:hypothetical protein CSKR_111554 [Clonorchis sinensis]|uniref:Uncharacterized protein n=1 Tax=Clonorchis sinensis TaxID=79923 RepID=A0A419PWM2_CLOSI|nr:hypothetical protein CSKR_111554 [Clonorchis sinensis]
MTYNIPSASDVDEMLEICYGNCVQCGYRGPDLTLCRRKCGKQAYVDCKKKCSSRRYKYICYGNCKDKFGMYASLFIFTPLSFERSSSCSGVIIPVSGHLTCEASVLPLLHQRTLDASEFSRLNRRTCSHLSDVIGVPDTLNDDPVSVLVVTIDSLASQDFPVR